MKAAVIFSIPLRMKKGLGWRWRSVDHTQGSTQSFQVYADCVTDAERKGYTVEADRVEGRVDLASRVGKSRS
jgi:hypothetical protein